MEQISQNYQKCRKIVNSFFHTHKNLILYTCSSTFLFSRSFASQHQIILTRLGFGGLELPNSLAYVFPSKMLKSSKKTISKTHRQATLCATFLKTNISHTFRRTKSAYRLAAYRFHHVATRREIDRCRNV